MINSTAVDWKYFHSQGSLSSWCWFLIFVLHEMALPAAFFAILIFRKLWKLHVHGFGAFCWTQLCTFSSVLSSTINNIFLYSFDIEEIEAGAINLSDEIANSESIQPPSENDSECQEISSDGNLETGERVLVTKRTIVTLINWIGQNNGWKAKLRPCNYKFAYPRWKNTWDGLGDSWDNPKVSIPFFMGIVKHYFLLEH